MHNKNISQLIRQVYESTPAYENIDFDMLETVIINCDHYIRPGACRTMFMQKFGNIIDADPAVVNDISFKEKLINLIKCSFDLDFYNSNLNTAKDLHNSNVLTTYLKKFSSSQLKLFMQIVITSRLQYDLFMSNASSTDMWKELNQECRKVDSGIPHLSNPAHRLLTAIDPLYHFNYLSKKTIAKIFCDHVDKDINLAGRVAKVFYNSGSDAALACVNSELRKRV